MEVRVPPCNSQRLGVGSESFSHLNHLQKWLFLPFERLTPTAQKCFITASRCPTNCTNFHFIIRATHSANPLNVFFSFSFFSFKVAPCHSGVAALQIWMEEGTLKGMRGRLELGSGEQQEGRRWIEIIFRCKTVQPRWRDVSVSARPNITWPNRAEVVDTKNSASNQSCNLNHPQVNCRARRSWTVPIVTKYLIKSNNLTEDNMTWISLNSSRDFCCLWQLSTTS